MVIACGTGQTEADPAFSQLHTTTATHGVSARASPASKPGFLIAPRECI